MFIATSINEKLKKTMNEMEPDNIQTCEFPYKRPEKSPAIFTTHNHPFEDQIDSNYLFNLSKKEWESTFTLPHLRNKWKEKIKLNFDPNFKKIPDSLISEKTKEAKQYVKNLVDPDALEVKKKYWNISNNAQEKIRPELRKTVFEASQGLNNFQVVPLKEKFIEEGIDSRNYMYVNGEKWNNSTLFEKFEKDNLNYTSRENAFENTIKYWRKTSYDRFNENPFPISNERKYLEQSRYYKKYLSPKNDAIYKYNVMKKVKEDSSLERERVMQKIIHDNPGLEKNVEKINSLVEKAMSETYKEKFNYIIGKNKRSNTAESYKKNWKDEELVEKVNTINNWNNVSWFKPLKNDKEDFYDKTFKKRELLKPLVSKGNEIKKEEHNIHLKNENEYKKDLKKKLLNNRNKLFFSSNEPTSIKNSLKISKYPIEKKAYESILKSYEESKSLNHENEDDIIYNENDIINLNENTSNKLFLEAYKNVTLNDIKEKRNKRKNEQWIEYKYIHLGKYREFEFKKKVINENEIGKVKIEKEKVKCWSCCMNTDENARGCKKIRINRLKWNLDNA